MQAQVFMIHKFNDELYHLRVFETQIMFGTSDKGQYYLH
jgi:hypothetical protein